MWTVRNVREAIVSGVWPETFNFNRHSPDNTGTQNPMGPMRFSFAWLKKICFDLFLLQNMGFKVLLFACTKQKMLPTIKEWGTSWIKFSWLVYKNLSHGFFKYFVSADLGGFCGMWRKVTTGGSFYSSVTHWNASFFISRLGLNRCHSSLHVLLIPLLLFHVTLLWDFFNAISIIMLWHWHL